MSPDNVILTPAEHDELELTVLKRHRLEEQYRDLDQQQEAAALGMWVFLATEVLFFSVLFLGLSIYRYQYGEAFAKAGAKLNWIIGSINAIVMIVSSLSMTLGVHYTRLGRQRAAVGWMLLTVLLGVLFLCLKGLEYYTDYRDNLIPGWRFDDREWIGKEGLAPSEVPHVKLFLLFYWVMTGMHTLHLTIGIGAVLVIAWLAYRGHFSPDYWAPVDVTGLYWSFVDIVWLFLLPMLYLAGTHTMADFHF